MTTPRLEVGSRLCGGRFEVLGRLGEGGMGVVYEAFDNERCQSVALKGLSLADATSLYRLKNEFRSLADVVHPNLVRLYELFADEGLWLFSMELVGGTPFDAWVRPGGELDEARLRSALTQLVRGVRAIHDAGKLHRDLKPDNVLVRDDGQVVILDFGLSTDQQSRGSYETMGDGRILGTPAYMAPEQADGQAVMEASDWYQVGVMLFEALTGRVPFEGTVLDIVVSKVECSAPRPGTLVDGVPADLDELCAALLSREPGDRPGAEQVAACLDPTSVDSVDTSLPPTTPVELIGRDAELAELRSAFERAAAGRLTVVRIAGESGVGKSALAASFLAELKRDGDAVVLTGRCYERESVPYNAFDGLVDVLSRYLRRQSPVDQAGLVPRNASALSRIFPVLDRVDAIATAPRRHGAGEGESRRRGFDGFVELLARICERHPLVLHVDDVQWTDEDSVLLFEHLCAEPVPVPCLFVLGHRPGTEAQQRALARLDAAVDAADSAERLEIALSPLGADDAVRLACALLPDAPGAGALARAVAAEADGSPYFIGELTRYVALPSVGEGPSQVSLEDALEARLATLSGEARRLLELLAIAGKPVPAAVVVDAAGGERRMHDELDRLHRAQLVRLAAGRTCECYHDRTRSVLAARMGEAARRDAHRRLAMAWCRRDDAEPELLYEHFVGAGDAGAAVEHAIAGAARAVHGLAFERAASLYGKAMALLGEERAGERRLYERLAECLSLAGRWPEAGAAFERAARLADGYRRRTYLLHHAAQHYLASGRREEGLPLIRKLFAVLELPWPRTRVGAMLAVGARILWLRLRGTRFRLTRADLQQRFDGLGRTAESWYPERPGEPVREMLRVDTLLGAGALVTPYDMARGLCHTTAFIVYALRSGEPGHVAVALSMLSTMTSALPFSRGHAQRVVDRAITLAREHAGPEATAVTLGLCAFTRLWDGRLREAAELGAEGVALLGDQSRANMFHSWVTRSIHKDALAIMGQVREAARLSDAIARDARELGDELAAMVGESVVSALLSDDVEQAERVLERKLHAIQDFEDGTMFHYVTAVERVCLALYRGRGDEALPFIERVRVANVLPFDVEALRAYCALQGIARHGPSARFSRVVRRARGRLGRHRAPRTEATCAHLDAALCLLDGETDAALAHLERASAAYERAEMQLHRMLVDWLRGQHMGDAEGAALAAPAEVFMAAQGIENPEAWARMLVAGVDRGRSR